MRPKSETGWFYITPSFRRSLARVVVLGAVSCASLDVSAQDVRVTGSTVIQYVEMRPLVTDSVSAALVTGDGLFSRSPEGYLVRCVGASAFCRFTKSGDPVYMAPAIQDLAVSVWGIGRGVRGYARLRGRGVVAGEEDFWPQSGDPYDLMVAYAEISRGVLRFRGGRQWKVSGLGYYNFDGASALLRRGGWSFEAYGGWSLARGQNEPRTSESLAAIETFVPESRAVLIGAELSYQPDMGTAVRALYQREIRDDRLGLYSERLGLDGVVRRGRVAVDGAVEIDAALERLNEARVIANVTLRPDLSVGLSARRHRPFFELWTIWGAFDPVGFDEYGANIRWTVPGASSVLAVRTGRRGYEDHNASTTFGEVRSTGWYVGVSASTRPAAGWLVQAAYGTDVGLGAARSDANLRVRRELGDDAHVGVGLQAYQRLYEFRVREGTVVGIGTDAGFRLRPRVRLAGSLTLYRHFHQGADPDPDWSQVRGSLQVDWTVGAEPASPIGTGVRR